MSKRSQAYLLLLEISDDLRDPRKTYERSVWGDRYTKSGIERLKTEATSQTIKGLDWVNISHEFFSNISNPTIAFVIKKMMPGLKMYNLLWYFPTSRDSTNNRALKELTHPDNRIVYRTEVPSIFILNPTKIWKGGNPLICLAETKELLREHLKPSPEIVKDLRPRSGEYSHLTSIDQYHKLLGDEDIERFYLSNDK